MATRSLFAAVTIDVAPSLPRPRPFARRRLNLIQLTTAPPPAASTRRTKATTTTTTAALASSPARTPPGRCRLAFSTTSRAQEPTTSSSATSAVCQSQADMSKPHTTPSFAPTLYIDGQWVHSSTGASRQVINPATAEPFAVVDEASAQDAERAIASAKRCFHALAPALLTPPSSSSASSHPFFTPQGRSALLKKLAMLLVRDKETLSRTETLDSGKTLNESRIDVDECVKCFRYYAEEVLKEVDRQVEIEGRQEIRSRIVHEPVGVAVLITPWNYPLMQLAWKLAPALGTGNVAVIKPSEVTPLSTVHLVRLCIEAGFPTTSIQLLLGSGASIGDVITSHADVDLVSFTGGLNTGRHIIRKASDGVKRTTVELGGKNPHLVFADALLRHGAGEAEKEKAFEEVVDNVLTGVFTHSGQVCSSGARLVVEDEGDFVDRLVQRLKERAERIVVGDGLDERSETGPLVSAQQLSKVEKFVEMGLGEGARLVTGGFRPTTGPLSKGYFFPPTIFDQCDRSMEIVQQETFGPILTIERFAAGDEEHAIRLGNDTRYGLAAGVQTSDLQRATRVAARLRHGTVWINTYNEYDPSAEWGGFGMSGNGRELGPKGLDEYREVKHVWENTRPGMMGWFKL